MWLSSSVTVLTVLAMMDPHPYTSFPVRPQRLLHWLQLLDERSNVQLCASPVTPGEVQLFDFDQACYGWFLQDLVNPIYPHYLFPAVSIPDATIVDLALFFRHLVSGYGPVAADAVGERALWGTTAPQTHNRTGDL